jgi:hypothetical protein
VLVDKLRSPVSVPLLLIRAVGLLFIPLFFEMTEPKVCSMILAIELGKRVKKHRRTML